MERNTGKQHVQTCNRDRRDALRWVQFVSCLLRLPRCGDVQKANAQSGACQVSAQHCLNHTQFVLARGRVASLLLLFACLQAESVFALSSGDRIQVTSSTGVKVRQTAGGTAYASGQVFNALGVITGSPVDAQIGGTGTTYTWYYVDFDSGQDGWVATVGFGAIVPNPPTLIYPGDGSTVPVINTLTPTFQWNAVLGANGYGLYVQQGSTFPVDTNSIGNTTSYTVAAGVLQPGTSYVWNMRAKDSAGFSAYSSGTSGRFYFQTAAGETISTPGAICCEGSPVQGTLYTYSVGASTSSLGHTVEYSFTWGDGTSSSYSTSTSASHSWSTTGVKYLYVTARCQTHTSISANNSSANYYVTVQPTLPSPDLVSVSGFPSSTGVGQPFTVTVTAQNNAGTGGLYSSINASILYSDGTDDVAISDATASWADALYNWAPGATINNNLCVTMSAVDHLVEAEDNSWTSGEQHAMSFTVTPTKTGTLYVRARVTLHNGDTGCTYVNDTSASGGTASTDQQGWAVRQFSVSVFNSGPSPVAVFSGDLQPVTGKLSTYNGGYSTGTGLSYSWTVSDGRTSSAIAPSFAFNSPGTYTISLTVTDSSSRTSSASARLYVQAANNGSTPGQPVGADPVVLSAGNYVQERVDLRMPGKGFPFEFKRFYNSKFGDQTGLPLGFGWTHSYNERIKDNGTNALVSRGDGSTWAFYLSGGGYTNEPGVFDVVATNSVAGGWMLTDKNQMVKRFDTNGLLVSIKDKNGNALTNSYIGGVLRKIEDPAGRAVVLNTNGYGCISDITDPIGRTVHYEYDTQTNLVRVIDASGNVSSNRYDPVFHQLTDAYDPKGNCFVHNEYDTNTFVVLKQRDAFSNWTFFAYDFTNRITYQTNVLGKVSIHVFDERLLPTNIVDEARQQQSFVYDANRNRILVKDKNGNSTGYGYDARGNVTNKTDALSNVTAVEYNATNNPSRRIDALNHSTTFAYNASGNLTQTTNALSQVSLVEYNASGLPLVLTDANGHKTTNTFDAQGNLTKVQDALGNTTAIGYDAAGRKVAQTNANTNVTRHSYDNNDNLLSVVDPLGGTNSYIYDANNNRIVTIDARGAATTNTFDAKDRLISVRDASGGVTSYEYDALDHKTKVTDARSGVTKFGYDDLGNLVASTNALNQVTRYTYDANGNQTSVINPIGQTTTNIFDTLNRLVMTIDPLGHTNRTVYDELGRRVQTIDALNRTNQLVYDFVGRLTQVTDAGGGTTRFSYDAVGNRLVTTDPNNHSTTNTFDVLNQLVQTREPGGGVYQFAYDGVGSRTNQIDPKLQTIRYSYDGNNRRTAITYPTGTLVAFGYDANGNRTNMVDGLGTTMYQYDALNRLVSVTDAFDGVVSCGYDANGNRVSLTYPGSKTVTYGYDLLNRMLSVTNWLNRVTTYSYDPAGNLINTVNPNASRIDYGYDAARRLISLSNSGPASAIISSYAYTLDAMGNHRQVDQVDPTQALPGVETADYTYDSDNRMVTINGQAQAFDANGNMLAINTTNLLAYDYENRLTETAFGGKTNSYQYDGAGNRLWANRDGAVTRYVLDRTTAMTQVLAETDSSGTPKAYYVYGLGLISRIDSGSSALYYYFDSRGSTVALTDASGQVTDAYAYDPFGTPGAMSGNTDNRFRYLGRHGVVDEENGLNYIRARYYSTRRGRFISKDPLTGNDNDGQSLNRYVYALNNPVRLIDISGLSAHEGGFQLTSCTSSDSSHDLLLRLDDLLQQLAPGALKEFATWGVQRGVTSLGGFIAYHSAINPAGIGKVTGAINAGIDLALILKSVGYDPVMDAIHYGTAHPEADNIEVLGRFFVNISVAAVTAIPRAYLDEKGGDLGSAAIGIGYDAYHTQIQDAAYDALVSGKEWVGDHLGGAIYNFAPGLFQ